MKILLILFLLSNPFFSKGQIENTSSKNSGQKESLIHYPKRVLIVGTTKLTLDSITIKKVNPKWISKIEVVKDEKYKNIFSNPPDPDVFIFVKKRYYNQIRITFEIKQ